MKCNYGGEMTYVDDDYEGCCAIYDCTVCGRVRIELPQ